MRKSQPGSQPVKLGMKSILLLAILLAACSRQEEKPKAVAPAYVPQSEAEWRKEFERKKDFYMAKVEAENYLADEADRKAKKAERDAEWQRGTEALRQEGERRTERWDQERRHKELLDALKR